MSTGRPPSPDPGVPQRFFFEENPLPMWIFDVETLAFLDVNRAAIAHYGFSREEFLAMTIKDIRPPEDVPRLIASHARPHPGRSRPGVFRHRKRDGAIIEVDIVSHAVEYAGRRAELILANDVTEQVRAERALRDREEQYRMVTEGVPLQIAYLDVAERFLFVNHPAENGAMLGRTVREVMGDEAYARVEPFIRRALRGERVTYPLEHVEPGGTSRHFAIALVPRRDEAGEVIGYFAITSDETDRQRLEEQYRQARKMEAVGNLAGGLAHDFNNLLTVITTMASLLAEDERLEPDQRSDVEELRRAAARASDLTRQLLAFGRKQTLQPRAVDLRAVVVGIEKLLGKLLREDIALRVAPGAPVHVFADPGQLEHVLVNLVVNARDAMPRGGAVSIEIGRVELDGPGAEAAGLPPGAYAMLAVQDEGVGMAPAVLTRAFEPFFTTKPLGKGTGLGLSTVYGIAKQSGGGVWLESAPGRGTTVRVYLPLHRALHAEPATPAAEVAPRAAPLRGSETLLLVEDEDAVRAVARRVLAAHGYEVLCASDGKHALELVAGHPGRIDLLLTDVVMPRLGGPDLARILAAERPGLRVVFASGYAADALRGGVLPPGVGFLHKPFTPEALVRAVREVLDA